MRNNYVVGAHRPVANHHNAGRVAIFAAATGALAMGAATSGSTVASASETPLNAATASDAAGSAAVPTLLPTSEGTAPAADAAPLAAAPQLLPSATPHAADTLLGALETSQRAATVRAERDAELRMPEVVAPTTGMFTSGFEMRWGTFHTGIDIANAVGTPIYAIADGVVIESGPASGYGNWIQIRHKDGTVSLYGHMETLDVIKGQQVKAGQKIAGMGNRGFSTGSHLHFEIHPGGGAPVDPAAWLATHGIDARALAA